MSATEVDPPYFAHPSATVDDGATIGEGTKIWHYCHISSGSRIGRRCGFGQNCYVAPGVVVGDDVRVQNNVSLYEGAIVEDDVFFGPSAVMTNVRNPRGHVSRKSEYERTHFERGCTIGANATIICGVRIGRYAFVGAGATVSRDVPAFGLVLGVPARLRGYRCQCGEALALDVTANSGEEVCDRCSARYHVLAPGTLSWLNEKELLASDGAGRPDGGQVE